MVTAPPYTHRPFTDSEVESFTHVTGGSTDALVYVVQRLATELLGKREALRNIDMFPVDVTRNPAEDLLAVKNIAADALREGAGA